VPHGWAKVRGAALDANRNHSWIEEQVRRMLAEAEATDAAEDKLYGDKRGDELPEDLRSREERLAKLRATELQFRAHLLGRELPERSGHKKVRGR
jgi:hypothetical protein